ncbi:hypothetical protein Adu01nite_33070 [Paractinoplanes durhamensis]|uniref:DUF2029 domain-containing protein n=1 Tax=Paractinoplanes durhamensis TaxID=113563 RepID=A0ABQ3YWN3_9ACTN|nr:hypothetical protein Adu01nite_33070 [Actinoplanes durhamensis]
MVAALLAALFGVLTVTVPPDVADFAAAADQMLHGRLGEVYAAAWNQAGPAQLLISRLLMIGGGRDGLPALPVVALVDAALVVAAMWLGRGDRRRELCAGGLALLWVLAPLPWNGHPAELAIPVLWAYAISLKKPLPAAAVLALGVAIAPWAMLGIPCLLAAVPLRRALWTGVLAAGLGVACYLPFVLTGHFAMFDLRWRVASQTIAGLLGVTEVTWWLRLAQGVIVAGGVALIAGHSRGLPQAVPLAAALLRVVTDPVAYPYYWYPVAVASFLLLAVERRRLLITGGIGYLALLAESGNWTVPGALACLALVVVMIRKTGETEATFPAVIATR